MVWRAWWHFSATNPQPPDREKWLNWGRAAFGQFQLTKEKSLNGIGVLRILEPNNALVEIYYDKKLVKKGRVPFEFKNEPTATLLGIKVIFKNGKVWQAFNFVANKAMIYHFWIRQPN